MKEISNNSFYKSRSLFLLVIFSVLLIGLWAYKAKIYEVVQGTGRVVPQVKTQQVQHLEGGIVKEIFVSEGEHVKKGQPLFLIDSLATSAEYNELMITRDFSNVKIKRLNAEKEGKETFDVDVPTSNFSLYQTAQAEKSLFEARKKEFERGLSIIDEQINQKELEIEKFESEKEKRLAELDVAKKQLEINLRLRSKGVISETKLLDSQSQVTSLDTRLTIVSSEIPVVTSELEEARQKRKRVADERLSKILSELNDEKVNLERVEEQLRKIKDRLTRATVLSPSDGIVNSLFVLSSGAVVQPGAPLLELTPTDGNVLIEGRIRASDRGDVWLGQSVIVRVSAYDYTKYGALDGKVVDISADSFVTEREQIYYRVKIQLDLSENKNGMEIMPGMTADFHIRTGVKTVLQMLFAPAIEELWFNMSPLNDN